MDKEITFFDYLNRNNISHQAYKNYMISIYGRRYWFFYNNMYMDKPIDDRNPNGDRWNEVLEYPDICDPKFDPEKWAESLQSVMESI